MEKIGFGGSCHWCTEAIFQSLRGVSLVEQGWIASDENNSAYSEAVIVTYDPASISLATLIAIHLYTHSCTSVHTMRSKYRSAIYTVSDEQALQSRQTLKMLQQEFSEPIITKIIPLAAFKLNEANYLNYYYSNPQKPFCKNIINPKLAILLKQFKNEVDSSKLALL